MLAKIIQKYSPSDIKALNIQRKVKISENSAKHGVLKSNSEVKTYAFVQKTANVNFSSNLLGFNRFYAQNVYNVNSQPPQDDKPP